MVTGSHRGCRGGGAASVLALVPRLRWCGQAPGAVTAGGCHGQRECCGCERSLKARARLRPYGLMQSEGEARGIVLGSDDVSGAASVAQIQECAAGVVVGASVRAVAARGLWPERPRPAHSVARGRSAWAALSRQGRIRHNGLRPPYGTYSGSPLTADGPQDSGPDVLRPAELPQLTSAGGGWGWFRAGLSGLRPERPPQQRSFRNENENKRRAQVRG